MALVNGARSAPPKTMSALTIFTASVDSVAKKRAPASNAASPG
jgi:hypothetical protein